MRKTVSYQYDLAGNRRSRTELDGTGSQTRQTGYQWDYANRLVQAGDGGPAAPNAGQSATYKWDYDYRTRRIQRLQQPATGQSTSTRFNFSGGQSIYENTQVGNGGSSTRTNYIRGSDWGGGVGGILMVSQGNVRHFNHYNNRGDIVLQSRINSDEAYQAQYEAFGTRTAESGTKRGRQGTNSKDEEPELNLLNEGYRYRDLETGTFLTRDPLGFVDGPNLYAYVLQNPWSKFDPEGLQTAGQFFTDLALQESGARNPEADDPNMYERVSKTPDLVTPIVEVAGATGTMATMLAPTPAITGGAIAPAASKGGGFVDNLFESIGGFFSRFSKGGSAKTSEKAAEESIEMTAQQISRLSLEVDAAGLPKFTFRGDTRSPAEIFEQGFKARGDSENLLAHALDSSNPPSAFSPTSRSADVAADFSPGSIYVVRPTGGIDVNAALGAKSPFPNELEIAIPRVISPGDIRVVTLPDQGVSVLNPNWQP